MARHKGLKAAMRKHGGKRKSHTGRKHSRGRRGRK